MSALQIMINNHIDIFGEDDHDHIICDDSQKSPDDIKTTVNTAGKKRKFKIKYIIPLNYLCAVDDVDVVNLVRINEICTCKTLALFWPTGNFLATFRSINEAKMGIQKNFSLQIFTEDIPNCDKCLTVWIINCGSILAMRKLQEHSKCYEYPHAVIMTHLQHTYSRLNSKNSATLPILPGLFGKDLNLEEGQFILKPRYSALSQQQNAKERLHNKQRSYRTSRFHRGSVPHQDQVCNAPTVNKKGKLFGKELSSISNDGKWPTAILDILSLLREKGPTTEGIFNISPNKTLCKIVKEKLDSGQKVDIRRHSVHVATWILKEFLQTIKGSLLTSQLYEHWLAVPLMVHDEGKLAAVKSLLEELPPSNAAFLGQLCRILNKIARNSPINHMPAYNLSSVLAPFLLCLPSCGNKVLANDSAKKISLVTFLIDYSPKLFGLDVEAVWYETSFYHPPIENTSCAQIIPSTASNPNETDHGVSSCPRGRTYTPGHDEPAISPATPPQSEDSIESENREDNMNATQQAACQTPPAPLKKKVFRTFPPIVCLDKMLPSILDMLSIIAEKGQESDQIFRFMSEKSHWSLRNKIYAEQQINWNEESVLTVASVLKDFIRNIQGSLLSSDLYENWLSILDEESMLGKISAIQSMSVIQIMIDNCVDIFGEDDHIICDDSQKSSDDIKTTVNTAVGTMKQLHHMTFNNGNVLMTKEGADHSISVLHLTSYLTRSKKILLQETTSII
ncbi:Predicted gene 1527 [Apodemus speciosus]|uniref:Predicted gene 1527 n=1 Tax=Apodemus speciosus TaxID=105296 RepID=A0ABQ0EL33_APOSI